MAFRLAAAISKGGYGSFDGVLMAVDLRGDMQKAALKLSAGGKEIECIVNAVAVSQLGDALDERVNAYGLAHDERTSGLPDRLDVRDLKIIPESSALNRWRGAFEMPADDRDQSGWDRPSMTSMRQRHLCRGTCVFVAYLNNERLQYGNRRVTQFVNTGGYDKRRDCWEVVRGTHLGQRV